MKLSPSQQAFFEKNGYITIPGLFTGEEITRIIHETAPLKVRNSPEVIWEEDQTNVRALMGCHLKSEFFRRLVKQPRVLEPARQLLGSDVYVYQFKINLKAAFNGEIWPWHQDFIYWHELDGLPAPRIINIAILLDDCNEYNGPLWLIPESHKEGIIRSDKKKSESGDWRTDVSADLTFKLDANTVTRLVGRASIASIKEKAGSVLIFDPNIAHASLPNISPFERKLLIITYNSVENLPLQGKSSRPWFLVSTETAAETSSELELLTK